MGDEKAETIISTIIQVDPTNDFSYSVCSVCEKPLPKFSSLCHPHSSFSSKRLFRFLMSIASDTKVFRVICFDRAAKVLFGCSADDLFHFAKFHPFAASNAAKMLEGEMCRMTLAKPKNGNAQHLRVSCVVPLSSGFQPVIQSLKEIYGV